MSLDLQRQAANLAVADLNRQSDTLGQYATIKASALAAKQVNRWNYNLGRILAGKNDGLEAEVSQEFQRKNPNFQTNGTWIPTDALTKDLSFSGNAADLVSPSLPGPSIVDALRPFCAALKLGVETLQLPVTGTFKFPREQATPVISFGTENQTFTSGTDTTFDQLAPTNLRRASFVDNVSRELMQLAPVHGGIRAWQAANIVKNMGVLHDYCVIAGTGANNQPLGIISAPQGSGAINTITISNPTLWSQICAADSTVENLNAQAIDGTTGWLVNPNTKSSWKQTPKTPTALTNGFCAEYDSDTVNGHRLFTTKQVGNFAVFSTRWSNVLLVMAPAVSVLVDPYTNAASGQVRIVVDCLLDVVIRRPEAICVGATTF